MHAEAVVFEGNAACGDGSCCIVLGFVSPTSRRVGLPRPAALPKRSLAPANLDYLRGMQTTGTALELESVPQTSRKVDQFRANLANIQMPPGFSIDLYAIVPEAWHVAVGTNAGVVYVGT